MWSNAAITISRVFCVSRIPAVPMSSKNAAIWDARTRQIYIRLLGYTGRFWMVGAIALVGMVIDGGGLAAFTKLLPKMIDKLFAEKDEYLIFWMPI